MAQRSIALLRGLNVGGTNQLKMADLRALIASLGLGDVETYIQSGNVLFSHGDVEAGERIRHALADRFGMDVAVVIRTRAELERVIDSCPFDSDAIGGRHLHVAFLAHRPDPGRAAELDPERSPPDRFELIDREIFVHYPNGSGRSRIGVDYLERTLGVPATMRNWNTVLKLSELARG